MAKGKKKKDLDFQKVKLKVGRRLKRDSNETKAEFNSRKIILKEVKSYSNDPITALARHSEHISQHGKLSLLNHFNSALAPDIVKSLNKPILDSLSKFLVDQSDQVRSATIKCLKTCYNCLKLKHLPTKEFMQSLKPYLDCAYTHVSIDIVADCQRFIEHFININDPQLFEPLMDIILRRFEVGNLTAAEKSIAVKLKLYYLRYKQKQAIDDLMLSERMEPLKWTETNFLLDLDPIFHFDPPQVVDKKGDVIVLVEVVTQEGVVERFMDLIKNQDLEPAPAKLRTKRKTTATTTNNTILNKFHDTSEVRPRFIPQTKMIIN